MVQSQSNSDEAEIDEESEASKPTEKPRKDATTRLQPQKSPIRPMGNPKQAQPVKLKPNLTGKKSPVRAHREPKPIFSEEETPSQQNSEISSRTNSKASPQKVKPNKKPIRQARQEAQPIDSDSKTDLESLSEPQHHLSRPKRDPTIFTLKTGASLKFFCENSTEDLTIEKLIRLLQEDLGNPDRILAGMKTNKLTGAKVKKFSKQKTKETPRPTEEPSYSIDQGSTLAYNSSIFHSDNIEEVEEEMFEGKDLLEECTNEKESTDPDDLLAEEDVGTFDEDMYDDGVTKLRKSGRKASVRNSIIKPVPNQKRIQEARASIFSELEPLKRKFMENILVLLKKIPTAQLKAITNEIFRLLGGWGGTADIGIVINRSSQISRRDSMQGSTMASPDINATCPQ